MPEVRDCGWEEREPDHTTTHRGLSLSYTTTLQYAQKAAEATTKTRQQKEECAVGYTLWPSSHHH